MFPDEDFGEPYEDPLFLPKKISKNIGNLKHGDSKSVEYKTWTGMKNRCFNINHPDYERYGRKGIIVCDAWKNDYLAFLNYIGRRPSKHYSIDRYPNNKGNYEPGNVRWATIDEQANNKKTKYNTNKITKVIYIKEKKIRIRKDGRIYQVGRPKDESTVVYKIGLGFNEECSNNLTELAKKLRRSKADTIRTMITYGYKKFVIKDSSGDEDMRLEEEVLIG